MKRESNQWQFLHCLMKHGLAIRYLFVLVTLASFQSFANEAKTKSTVSIQCNDMKVKHVLLELEKQLELTFLYNSKFVNVEEKISIDVEQKTLQTVLNRLFESQDVKFVYDKKHVVISRSLQKEKELLKGTVSDQAGEPLPGVAIMIKGSSQGTVSDFEGNYSIELELGKVLVFSFIGMKSNEISFTGQSELPVQMEPDAIGLDEVVAIGYGSVKKSDLTGAVGSIKGDAVASRKTTQVSQALQGAVSGVMVTRSNNAPGSTASIKIRGVTTIGDTNPLIIVDGVPVDDINDINPNDIENISVLKDAASASIYGSRAASGVILITTRRAKDGQLQLGFSYEYGLDKPTALPEYTDAVRYMEMVNELRWNDAGNGENQFPEYEEDVVLNYAELNKENPNNYPDTDWVDLILKDSAPRQTYVFDITAGGKNIRTKASIIYDQIGALYEGRNYERITGRFNNDIRINDKISASLDFSFKRSISETPSVDPIYYSFISAPVYAAQWEDGRIAEGKSGANIYGQLKEGGWNKSWSNKINAKASIDIRPFTGLKLSAIVAPSLYFYKSKSHLLRVPYYSADDPSIEVGTLQWGNTTKVSENRNDNNRMTYQFIGNYDKQFGAHNVNVMTGYENYYAFSENLSASRDQYDLTSFPYLDQGPLEYRDNGGNASENAYRSYFGRVMYNYNSKYFIQANIRRDGSSRFHKDYRWGMFPSFSAGWVLSEESLLKDNFLFSYLKLRASWGRLGNERIGNYPYQSTMAFSNGLFYNGSNVVSGQTAAQRYYAIEDISWETTETTDIGADMAFLDNRLRFTADYFVKETKDMLLQLEIPDYMGFDNPDQNTGKMKTRGWEVELGWNAQIGTDFRYSISGNLSDFKSEMGDLGGIEFKGDQVKFEGSRFNEWYGYISDGIYQTQEQVDASSVLNTNVGVGDIKYKDISGPDGSPDGKISGEYDKVLLGGSLPRYMYGANLNFGYKAFDLNVVLQGVGKQNSRMHTNMVKPLQENWGSIPTLLDGKYWSYYNTETQNNSAIYPRLSNTASGNNYSMSDFWMFNGGYFRLKNVTLTYSIPEKACKNILLKRAKLYASVSDLFTIDNYPKGWDPEVASSGYPITTSVVFGVNVNF